MLIGLVSELGASLGAGNSAATETQVFALSKSTF